MTIKRFMLVFFISIVLFSCTRAKVDLKKEEAAIMKADSTWAALAKEGKEVDKIISYWSDDAVVMQPGQPAVKGKEALRKMVVESMHIPGFSITWRSSDLHFSPDGEMAYMYGENLVNLDDSSGNKITIPGRGYTVWRKETDGSWKCVVDIWNNPPETK